MDGLTIGALAAEGGVNVETVRYYERRGLLLPHRRSHSGYRLYTDDDVWRLAFIRRAKGLGFTLAEIGELLGDREDRSVIEVLLAAQTKVAGVEHEIIELSRLRDNLMRLVRTCEAGDAAECLDLAIDEVPSRS